MHAIAGSSMLRRDALEDRLDEAFAKRLTAVVAGAGFGKSTLLAAWAADLECAWYSLTAKDTALPWLERGIVRAIAARIPAAATAAEVATVLGGAARDELLHADAFVAVLCDALDDALTHDLVLVLDDVHELATSPAAIGLVESLCRHAPATLHVVLASRSSPPFPIERLRAQNQVLELSSRELAFTEEEIDRLLAASVGEGRPELARRVYELTSGWPALVRLAVETLKLVPRAEGARTLDELRRPGSTVFGYLAEEVFRGEPERVRELVRTVALLERFTPDLCEELGIDRAAETIDDLGRRALFIERHDTTFALHSLVRDFALRAWPLQSSEAAAVLRRAARWLESHGEIEEALRALAAAGEHRELRRLLTEHGAAMVAAGAATTVTGLAELVPDHLRETRIDQLAGEAYTVQGEHERALECFHRAAGKSEVLQPALAWRTVQAHSLRDDLDEALAVYGRTQLGSGDTVDEALLFAFTASVRRRRGDLDVARDLAERALEAATACGDDRALAAAHLAAALVAPPDRDVSEREIHLTQALEAAERTGDVLQVIRIRNNRASYQLWEGRYETAIEELGLAIDLAELVGYVGLLALALMNRGLARWCLGRLDEASSDYEAAVSHYRRAGSREICYAIIGQGDVHRERGNLSLARASYEEGLSLAERSSDLQGLVPALYQLAKVLVDEEPERATHLAERAVAYGWPDPAWALNAAGWVALARGDQVRAAEAGELAAAAAREQRDYFGLAESLELQALATADRARAKILLQESLTTWREIGNPVHEAAVEIALAGVAPEPTTTGDAERAERKLRSLGVRVSPTGPAGLLRHVADAPALPVRIRALGGFRVQRDGKAIPLEDWRSRKSRDLLKILVARRGRPAPREFLMEALWPEADPTKLSNRLSVALSTLRAVLDPEKRFESDHFVHTENDAVSLENVAIDVEAFLDESKAGLSLRSEGRKAEAADRLEYAEAIYAGDFLEEDPYEEWAVSAREEARNAYVRVARALAEDKVSAGDKAGAAAYLLRILERDPYDEDAHLTLVGVLAADRRHGEARRAYRAYGGRLAKIGLEPAPFPAAIT